MPNESRSALPRSILLLGASGAVGAQVLRALQGRHDLRRVTLLNRRLISEPLASCTTQHVLDVLNPGTYRKLLPGHDTAICTLGVGQPSKVTASEFRRIDFDGALAFASACREAGVAHFQLLSAVGADPHSRSFYLRVKGELHEALIALQFPRLSLFESSMILTPTNRYGFSQGLMLAIWPHLNPLLRGRWERYRGIRVEDLGRAIAANLYTDGPAVEHLQWTQFKAQAGASG